MKGAAAKAVREKGTSGEEVRLGKNERAGQVSGKSVLHMFKQVRKSMGSTE